MSRKHHVFQVTVTICDVERGTAAAGEVRGREHCLVCQPQRLVIGVKQNEGFAIFPCVLRISESGSGVFPKSKWIEVPFLSRPIPEYQGCISAALIGFSLYLRETSQEDPVLAGHLDLLMIVAGCRCNQCALSILTRCPFSAMPFGTLAVWQTG